LDGSALTDEDFRWLSGPDSRYVQGRIDASRGLAAALTGGAEDPGRIWRWLAAFVIATLVGETFLTYRMIRRQNRPGAEVIGGATAVPMRTTILS